MNPEPTWTFERYRGGEDARYRRALAEQEQARAEGLVSDPKSAPHGGYRIACVWPDEVTAAARALSARLAALLPGTPAYPGDALHSSVGNIAAPGGRLVDPGESGDDRLLLDRLVEATVDALARAERDDRSVAFGPALLAPRMAYVFARPRRGYWTLHQAVHAACAARSLGLVPSWGPHLTLTRFAAPAPADQAAAVLRELSGWIPASAEPTAVLIGWYTVAPGSFSVQAHRTIVL